MNQWTFELMKIKSKQFLYLLVLVPILTILLTFTYRFFTVLDFQQQETVQANQLLNDLNWRLASFSRERGYYGPNQNQTDNPNELSEQDQLVFELLDEAERERFNYSVAAYYEDWHSLNLAKQKIWRNLTVVASYGEELRSISSEDLERDLYHIDWLVDYEVGTLDVSTDQNSQFVLLNAFDWLFSTVAMALIIFFFGLSMFMESKRPMFNFTNVLPVSYRKVMGHKLALFFSMLLTYILSIIAGSLILSIFDAIPLKAQLNYPIVAMTESATLIKPLWQVLIFQVIFFIGLILLSLVMIRLLTQIFDNELFVTFIYAAVVLIGSQVMRLFDVTQQTYNPFAWFDTVHFIQHQSVASIMTVLVILFTSVALLIWFTLLKDLKLPDWSRSKVYRGIRNQSRTFLIRFEALKMKRQSILFYSTAIIAAFSIYLGVQSYQHHVTQVDQVKTDYLTQIEYYEEAIPSHEELLDLYAGYGEIDEVEREMIIEYADLAIEEYQENLANLTAMEEEINKGEFYGLAALEYEELKSDYLYVKGEGMNSGKIPLPHALFMPNAYINYQLSEWKMTHEIDFVPPGGPYQTLFIPTYRDTPRSGEGQPPLGINRGIFDEYLNSVDQEHRYLSGLNLLADVYNQYFYLVILVLVAGFFSLSYVREWDNSGTIRYLLVQPIRLTKVFTAKMATSIGIGIGFTILASIIIFVIGSLLNGVGQLNFPFIQYVSDTLARSNLDAYLEIPMNMKYFQILPLWQWLLMGGALLLSNVLLINQLVYFLSTVSRNQWIVLGLSVAILGAGYLLSTIWPHDLLQFSPFQYLDIAKVLSGEVAVQHDYVSMNWWVGVISQTVASSLLTVGAVMRVRKEK